MKTYLIGRAALVLVALATAAYERPARADAAATIAKTLPNGDQVRFDGTAYDFRSGTGREMIKLWVPPGQKVRGIFISGHGGGGGDSRQFARYESLRAFAARLGFGLAGLHNFPGRRAYEHGAPLFFKALDAFADLGQHSELRHVPFAMYGSSNGGASTYGFVNAAPGRALCFLSNVSSSFNPEEPSPEALQVPGVIVVGMYDPFGRGQAGVDRATAQVRKARARGARWALMVEQKGHEDGISFDLYMKLVERALALRYPPKADPAAGPVVLRTIPEDSGWLADHGSFANAVASVAPYGDYAEDRATAGWLIDEHFARTYQAAATWDSPVAIRIKDVERIANPHTDPATMFAIGGPVVDRGTRMQVIADVAEVPDWQRVDFYDGARKLGSARAPAPPVARFAASRQQPVQVLSALVHTRSGQTLAAPPVHFFVRDPSVAVLSEAERRPERHQAEAVAAGSGSPRGTGDELARPDDGVLVAYGLTDRQEASFASIAGRPSPLWDELRGDEVNMTPENSGAEGSRFSIVTYADVRLTVKAAHSRKGVYLYFKVTDNHFVDADPAQYGATDTVELLVDARASEEINAPAMAERGLYLNPGWALTLSTRQYQVATGGRETPQVLRRNLPDPWDMSYRTWTLAEAAARFGMKVRHSKLGRMHRVQEWFIPWAELTGGALNVEPQVGTRLGFAISYNDTDEPHGPVKRLRWIDKQGPWRHNGAGGKPPRGWGDLVIGPTPGDRLTATTAP